MAAEYIVSQSRSTVAVDITNCNFNGFNEWKLFCCDPSLDVWKEFRAGSNRIDCVIEADARCTAGELIDFDQSAQEMGIQHGIVSFGLRMNVDLIPSHEIPFHFQCDRPERM